MARGPDVHCGGALTHLGSRALGREIGEVVVMELGLLFWRSTWECPMQHAAPVILHNSP